LNHPATSTINPDNSILRDFHVFPHAASSLRIRDTR
jgi:hypothetical protein